MEKNLAQKAVVLALSGNWEEAWKINQEILSTSPTDLDALNRLARCFWELNDITNAMITTQKVLVMDPQNTIAQKCLLKWKNVKTGKNHSPDIHSAGAFLEDAGKTKNEYGQRLIDFNRCGVPLIEIVTEPDLGSAEEAKAFVEQVSLLLQYAGVCDCKMEQGSLRADVNVSIMPPDAKAGPAAGDAGYVGAA